MNSHIWQHWEIQGGGFLDKKSLGKLRLPLICCTSKLNWDNVDMKVATLALVENCPRLIFAHACTQGRLSVSIWVRWRDSRMLGAESDTEATMPRASISHGYHQPPCRLYIFIISKPCNSSIYHLLSTISWLVGMNLAGGKLMDIRIDFVQNSAGGKLMDCRVFR